MRKYALPLLASAALAGCGTIRDHMSDPKLSPVATPMRHIATILPPPQEQYAPNSLWRAGARTFFNDQRASRVGDILTVKIQIDDNAQLSNSTQRSRKSSSDLGAPNLLGLETKLSKFLPSAVNPASLVKTTGDTSTQGQGQLARAEKVVLTVAAVITQILPNGNLVIDGSQQVLINSEMRNLTVAGVIRPEDISSDNTILHTQIAEARISYGGQGVLTTVQKPGWGQRVFDAVTPW
jgi:flagellar L-ring protein precursor FlgH